jgi:hypothetical protein
MNSINNYYDIEYLSNVDIDVKYTSIFRFNALNKFFYTTSGFFWLINLKHEPKVFEMVYNARIFQTTIRQPGFILKLFKDSQSFFIIYENGYFMMVCENENESVSHLTSMRNILLSHYK